MATEDPVQTTKPAPQKDEKFEAFLDARDPPLSEGGKDVARVAFYGSVYSELYSGQLVTNPLPRGHRNLSPRHSKEDFDSGMLAHDDFVNSVGKDYPIPGENLSDYLAPWEHV
jgi:hypothetical protein